MYLASLDAEKCFDSIWHDALLYKLFDVIELNYWLFICRWYKSSSATVRWNDQLSFTFPVQRGMRQGSVLSPKLFNIFLDELLHQLKDVPHGVRVFDVLYNSVVFADDVTVFSSTVVGLQELIDACFRYAQKYRFKFGVRKSKCLVMGKPLLITKPTWKLGDARLTTETELEVLGITFSEKLTYQAHVNKRATACRRRIFGLTSIGMSYPGLAAEVKAYLWNTVGAPMLIYGMDSIALRPKDLGILKSTQGTIVKKSMGFSKRHHHTNLLRALNIAPVPDLLTKNTVNLYHRLFSVDSPARALQCSALASYILTGKTTKNTLLGRIVESGQSPVNLILSPPKHSPPKSSQDGIVDSLRHLIIHDNYVKPYGNDHYLASLLLKAF